MSCRCITNDDLRLLCLDSLELAASSPEVSLRFVTHKSKVLVHLPSSCASTHLLGIVDSLKIRAQQESLAVVTLHHKGEVMHISSYISPTRIRIKNIQYVSSFTIVLLSLICRSSSINSHFITRPSEAYSIQSSHIFLQRTMPITIHFYFRYI